MLPELRTDLFGKNENRKFYTVSLDQMTWRAEAGMERVADMTVNVPGSVMICIHEGRMHHPYMMSYSLFVLVHIHMLRCVTSHRII